MNAARPFFMLLGRASIFWLGAAGFVFVLLVVGGLAGPDDRLGVYVDVTFIAAFGFPLVAGWLAGAAIQEFQHTSFAALLPAVRSRIAIGFLAAGLIVTIVAAGAIAWATAAPARLPLLLVIGLGAFCLGGIVLDPLSSSMTMVNVVLSWSGVLFSRDLARLAGEHPWGALLVSLALVAVCCTRLFARSTFRLKPLRDTSPLPGSYSFEKTRQRQRLRRFRERPARSGWRTGYLGRGTWPWVRAAVHETHGATGLKSIVRATSRAWGIGALFLLSAWFDKGELGYGEALARIVHDALFRSPYVPQLGEKGGPFVFVAIVVASAGLATALFSPIALSDDVVHPLSRRQRARVFFRGGLVDAAIFLCLVAPLVLGVGHLVGRLAGIEIRLDFMPFFLRVLLITLALMPLGYWGRVRMQAATRTKSGNTLVGVIFGFCGFVVVVGIGCIISAAIFDGTPGAELMFLAAALVLSQLVYRSAVTRYFISADLA